MVMLKNIIRWKKGIHTYVIRNFLKIENCGERNFPWKEKTHAVRDRALQPLRARALTSFARATGGSFFLFFSFLFFSVAGACVYAATQTHRSALAVFVRRQLADIPTAHAPHQTSRVAATISDSGGWLQKVNRLRRWPPAGSVLRCVWSIGHDQVVDSHAWECVMAGWVVDRTVVTVGVSDVTKVPVPTDRKGNWGCRLQMIKWVVTCD